MYLLTEFTEGGCGWTSLPWAPVDSRITSAAAEGGFQNSEERNPKRIKIFISLNHM